MTTTSPQNNRSTADRLTSHVIGFGRLLRRIGFEVGTEQILDALHALDLIGVKSRSDVYSALYSIFITHKEQHDLFNQAFYLFWKRPSRLPEMMQLFLPTLEAPQSEKSKKSKRVKEALVEPKIKPSQPKKRNEQKEAVDLVFTYSPTEVLRKKDFAEFSSEEVIEAKRIISEMDWSLAQKRIRRRVPNNKGRFLDLRRSMRKSMRQHGEMVKLNWQGRANKPRDIAILCDISGSMERYSRMLLHFMHAFTSGMRRVETFVFGTRLTRITRYLRHSDIDEALASVSKNVNDWAGGTRIGEAIKDFNYLWARRVLRSGAIVLVISDGWDRGDIALLEREMARLSRSCYRLIWLNPLLGYPDYQPLTRGIRAALPHIDDFLPVHNLESLEQLGEKLASIMKHPARRMVSITKPA